MDNKTIQFIRRGERVSLVNVPPERTLLEVLREDLGCTGTKEGCGEGDCGACTVVLGELEGGGIRYRAINSCIRLAHSVDGLALWTVEDIAPPPPDGTLPGARAGLAAPLHPAQEAMVQCHGSQCGFCTPGFVMSLFGMYQNHVRRGEGVTRALAQEELSGNLCRCTGYRPILDAAQRMADFPAVAIDEATLVAQLQDLNAPERPAPAQPAQALLPVLAEPVEASLPVRAEPVEASRAASSTGSGRTVGARQATPADAADPAPPADAAYLAPTTLAELLQARAAYPDAQVVAGCTDVGLWVTKMHMRFSRILDVTRAAELRRIERYPRHVAIGAAVTLADAFAALVRDRPQLKTFAGRFAGLPVRNAGTLGGNIANGSPIGDSMPLLIALGASVVLMSTRGHREMPLEALYTGYRKNVMARDELLAWIKVPLPAEGEMLRAYKISKRYDDDISAVCLVVRMALAGGRVAGVSIGAGGVAATPARALRTESALLGQPWTADAAARACATLRAEFQPISDMRASAAYRAEVLGNLMRRFWLESQGVAHINLERVLPEAA